MGERMDFLINGAGPMDIHWETKLISTSTSHKISGVHCDLMPLNVKGKAIKLLRENRRKTLM